MFQDFPRQELPFQISRRDFFSTIIHEVQVLSQATQGKPPFRLADLGTLSDQQLAGVLPVLNSAFEIYEEDGYVWAREVETGHAFRTFPFQKENIVAFSLFTGAVSLGEIGKRVAQEMGWEEARGFAHARGLFLSLVSHLVCLPYNPLDE